MKRDNILTISSLLSVVLFTLHLADDISRGIEKGDLSNIGAFPIGAVWLYGTLVLAERRSGHVIMLLGALLGLAIPYVHMRGRGIGVVHAGSDGLLLFAWTLVALGVASLLSVALATRGLWRLRPRRSGE